MWTNGLVAFDECRSECDANYGGGNCASFKSTATDGGTGNCYLYRGCASTVAGQYKSNGDTLWVKPHHSPPPAPPDTYTALPDIGCSYNYHGITRWLSGLISHTDCATECSLRESCASFMSTGSPGDCSLCAPPPARTRPASLLDSLGALLSQVLRLRVDDHRPAEERR